MGLPDKDEQATVSAVPTELTQRKAPCLEETALTERSTSLSSHEASSENILPHINRHLFQGQPKPHPQAFI